MGHPFWRANFSLDPQLRKTYLRCDDSINLIKQSSDRFYYSVPEVEQDLLRPMNETFGSDVFRIRVGGEKAKYARIYCLVCKDFDLWFHYTKNPLGEFTNLRIYRYILQSHDP